jgi:hypothetical protein
MKTCELNEGQEAFDCFDALVGKVLSVPHEAILRREAEHKKQSAFNPNKRSPKPKKKAVS